MAYIGKSPNFGVRSRYIYTASGSETSISGADDAGNTLSFSDGNYVDVYLNGVLLKPTTDYNTDTANTIAGLAALTASDIVEIIVYDRFSVADMVSAESGGTFSGAVNFNGGAVFNEDSADLDFRVESDNRTHALFVDGAGGNIGIDATPESWHSSWTAIDIGDQGSISHYDGGDTQFATNMYHDGAWKAKETGTSALYAIGANGSHTWYTGASASADASITTTNVMGLFAEGHINQYVNRNSVCKYMQNAHASDPYGMSIDFSAASPDDNDNYFHAGEDSSANRFKIYSDGDVWTSDAGILTSDERLKNTITDATDKWDDVKKLKVRNFYWNEDYHPNKKDKKLIGFIAQEFETVFPKLISEHNIAKSDILYTDNDQEVKDKTKKIGDVKTEVTPVIRKAVKEGKLIPILTKALQEAMTRIETLEAKVKALEEA